MHLALHSLRVWEMRSAPEYPAMFTSCTGILHPRSAHGDLLHDPDWTVLTHWPLMLSSTADCVGWGIVEPGTDVPCCGTGGWCVAEGSVAAALEGDAWPLVVPDSMS